MGKRNLWAVAMVAALAVGCAGDTVTNHVGVDDQGTPTIELETVTMETTDDSVTFVGPQEFQIRFDGGSVFVDSADDNHPGLYETTTGELILEVDNGKRQQLEPGAMLKYDVIVDGVVLDPFVIIK